ncbi:hypothetical protein NET02_01385 [Thermomicrobiaceae bacterium CFH 74404]|uniref:YtkA-like domain-containing protein n=1 Tax=Thermalbibacter longus TaxID=2951981 RepID=A0AA42B9X1_9BACT|nr:hypothetical protein [Thermalbibacter longus]MCM8747794.1 hypothetical protein [Thermalbibacter longus]
MSAKRALSFPTRLVVVLAVAIAGLIATIGSASAHEHRHVGEYEIVVGFLNEPAIVEEPNGLELRVMKGEGDAAQPVEGLADTLQAEVMYGDQVMPLQLRPAFGEPGSYKAEFIPTAEGAYTFHIFGTIEGTPIDERFTSGPETFSEVQSRADLSFPQRVSPASEIERMAGEANDAAATARLLGIAGLVVGLLGLIAGGSGLVLARRAMRSTSETARVMPREAES